MFDTFVSGSTIFPSIVNTVTYVAEIPLNSSDFKAIITLSLVEGINLKLENPLMGITLLIYLTYKEKKLNEKLPNVNTFIKKSADGFSLKLKK